ncbi:peptidoglycan-binding domain-containing protein [Actibacterium sp. MT2.3-13A]|uniref:peptidoglycan-binding domain-containing protein n=1 Tax=Actibacterium sp. MT2.3-13A TaxID=2828332 RepID=UPI001BA7BB5F|nr:peptidoglycan-binding domain-containing protein [Actibacterium sp. MT2.3-13A]
MTGPAGAQQGDLPDGAAVVTSFSGTMVDAATGAPVLDPGGKVARVLDLASPGYRADGSRWDGVPERLGVLARDAGQVFGIAVDGADPANIYLGASAAFGLFRRPDNSGWMQGMWGRGGGPGTVYRLRADNGYRPEVFANLTLDGRPNGGAGLGNIAYDGANGQLFVSDLENGMIYRIDAGSGAVLDTYDHGVEGRSYYLDSATAQYRFSDVVPFDPASAPRIDDCGAGPAAQAAARFGADPACWNIADFRRRVYGLGVQEDAETGAVRLYYAVWGAQGFDNPDWDEMSEDAGNTIWSVGLDEAGGFALDSVRREIEMPPFFLTQQEMAAQGASHPVTDIAFSEGGVMVVAERGGLGGVALPGDDVAVTPRGARVLLFARGEDGTWEAQGRFDVGYDERADLDPPHLRAAAAGGVALGYGYTGAGRRDAGAPQAQVWMTGDALCSALSPCPGRGGAGTDPRPATGVQGTPLTAVAALSPPEAFYPYPAPGPATPPDGVRASYIIGLGDGAGPLSAGHVGDIEIHRGRPAPAVPLALPDLAVAKSLLSDCAPNELCRFRITLRNAGPLPYEGPVALSDDIGGGMLFRPGNLGPWRCAEAGSHVTCYDPDAALAPGEQVALDLDFLAPRGIATTRVRNCAAIDWLGRGGRDPLRVVQMELAARGFDPGPADGVMGPNTAAALRAAESVFGLPQTGEVSDDLLVALFGPGGARGGDRVATNNRACVYADIDIPPPPAHWVQLSAFHRRFVSAMHDPRTSGPVDLHDPTVSSFHLRYRSSMHDGVTTRPIPYHRTGRSIFHRTWESSLHDPLSSLAWPSHRTALSIFHRTLGSGLHNVLTSLRLPYHNPRLTDFHRTYRSSRHNSRTTWEWPSHRTGLSVFHRTRRSAQHNPATSREWPIHRSAVSVFHRTHRSAQHDPATTRQWQVHRPVLSTFHRTHRSAQHDPATTRQWQVHQPALSAFHRTHRSAQHDPATTRQWQVHRPALSAFHRTHLSAQHDPATTRQRQVHQPALSAFHRTHQSAQHDPATTRQRQVHRPALSTFHRTHLSAQHDPATTRQRQVHQPALSTFHRTHQSAQHDPATTRQRQVHAQALSSFHRRHQSAQHNPDNSRQRYVHRPELSTFHETYRSLQHNTMTTRLRDDSD